jgi:exosortase/archaeosortase family protein
MEKATVFLGAKRLIGIADPCNGLSLIALFIGFMLAYPGKIYLKIIYCLAGIIFIIFLNISRCTGLALVHNSYPSLTDFAHHYVFKMITYGAIVYMWVGFVKINNKLLAAHA